MQRVFLMNLSCTIAFLCFQASPTFGDEKPIADQTWVVTFEKDTAIIKASPQTGSRWIKLTIGALQKSGIEEFSLRSGSTVVQKNKPAIKVSISSNVAELTVTDGCPYQYVKDIVSMLAANEVEKLRFSRRESKTAGPVAAEVITE